jgi:hypothetical protein
MVSVPVALIQAPAMNWSLRSNILGAPSVRFINVDVDQCI